MTLPRYRSARPITQVPLTHPSNSFDCALTHTLHTTDLIAECKSERTSAAAGETNPTSTAAGRRTRTRTRRRKIDLVGRRVIMSADVFGGNEAECYHGKIVGKSKYLLNGKTCNGFKVIWHDGDIDYRYTCTNIYECVYMSRCIPTHTHSHTGRTKNLSVVLSTKVTSSWTTIGLRSPK